MIQRYRGDRGAVPATLSDLVPAYADTLALDPFSGQVLKYVHDDEAYTVYSVGGDRRDDGGDLAPRARGSRAPGVSPDAGVRIRMH